MLRHVNRGGSVGDFYQNTVYLLSTRDTVTYILSNSILHLIKQMMTAVALCVLLKLLVFQSEETSKGTFDIVGDYLRNCYERTSWKLMTQMRLPVALCVEAARPVGHKSRAGKLFSLELDCTVLRTK